MIILRILFYAFLVYLAYKVIFDFILPVYRATKQVRRGFREMEEHMRRGAGPFPGGQPGPQRVEETAQPARPQQGDYIDFEEVK